MTWTVERIDRATKMAIDGFSATEIAAEIGGGLSRNAVIGKLNRMGVSLGAARKGNPGKRQRTRVARLVKLKTEKAAPKPKARPLHYLDVTEATDLPSDVSAFACTLLQLTDTSCRWPLGDPLAPDFRFCGAPQFGEHPYCARHCRMSYQPAGRASTPEERQRRAQQGRANLRMAPA